jgi:hypothetical protein
MSFNDDIWREIEHIVSQLVSQLGKKTVFNASIISQKTTLGSLESIKICGNFSSLDHITHVVKHKINGRTIEGIIEIS